jgi:hypothetical protein
MKRLILALPILAIALIAAIGPATISTANAIALVIVVIAPFILKYVKLGGPLMAILSYAVALVVAIGAGFYSKELTTTDFNIQNLLVTSGALWAVMQGVFQIFKDNHIVGKYLV